MLKISLNKNKIGTILSILCIMIITWNSQLINTQISKMSSDCNILSDFNQTSNTLIFLQKPSGELYLYDMSTHELNNLNITSAQALIYILPNKKHFLSFNQIPQIFIPPLVLQEMGGRPTNFLNIYALSGEKIGDILWDDNWSALFTITEDNQIVFFNTGLSTFILQMSLINQEITSLGEVKFASDVLSDYMADINSQVTHIVYTETKPALGGGELVIQSLDSGVELWRGEFYRASDLLFNTAWSPNGKQFTFPRKVDTVWQIFLWNTDLIEPEQLTADIYEIAMNPRKIRYLTWSPDSAKLAYWRTNNFPLEPIQTEPQLYILDTINKSIATYCVPESSLSLPIQWSPDMQYIGLSTSQTDGTIYILDLLTSEIHLIPLGFQASIVGWIEKS